MEYKAATELLIIAVTRSLVFQSLLNSFCEVPKANEQKQLF